jgi:hypothetical protein
MLDVGGPHEIAAGVPTGRLVPHRGKEHAVRARPDPWHQVVVRLEDSLLGLDRVPDRIAVEGQRAHLGQRVVAVRPHLGEVERVEPVGLGLLERHDLHLQRPARVVAPSDRLVQVLGVMVRVGPGQLAGVGLGPELDALVGDEVVPHPEPLAAGVDPQVGVAGVQVHVPPGLREPAVAHQPDHLVGRLRQQGPEVPPHVVGAKVDAGQPLLGPDEVLEVDRILDEAHRRVSADQVVGALGRAELDRDAADVPPDTGATALTGHGGEPEQKPADGPRLEHRGLGVSADVIGHLESAERTAGLTVRLPLGDPFPVAAGQLLD